MMPNNAMGMTKRPAAEIVRALAPRWLKRSLPGWLKARVRAALDRGDRLANGGPAPSPATRLRSGRAIRWEIYERMWNEEFGGRTAGEAECFRMHKVRYFELFDTMVAYLAGRATPRVLDIGTSEFLPLYKRFLPHMELVTIDRPTDQHGFDPRYAIDRGNAVQHYSADLNQIRLTSAYGIPPLRVFDYILCAEVLEHLVVNPIELLEDLIGLLKPEGYLYLTTPNFFSHRRMKVFARGENPQAIFPRRGQNWDAHYHFREYTLGELVQFAAEAGGRVVESSYSACWDESELKAGVPLQPDQLSNLVVLVSPGSRKK